MPAKVIHGHSIEIELGPSCPNPGIRRELEAQGKPYMCTSDLATWIGVDNKWYYVYRPGVSTSIIPLLEPMERWLKYELNVQPRNANRSNI